MYKETAGNSLLHGQVVVAFGDAGYQGIERRPDAKAGLKLHEAIRQGKREAWNLQTASNALIDKAKKIKAGIRARLECPFRVFKWLFKFVKVRYRICGWCAAK